jgi:hypothetical protein
VMEGTVMEGTVMEGTVMEGTVMEGAVMEATPCWIQPFCRETVSRLHSHPRKPGEVNSSKDFKIRRRKQLRLNFCGSPLGQSQNHPSKPLNRRGKSTDFALRQQRRSQTATCERLDLVKLGQN